MNEEQRITKVEKEKDPRRVASGKRLGAISKMCKEKKALERQQQQQQQHMERIDEEEEGAPSGGYSAITVITGVGVGLVCLYFTYKQGRRTQTQNTNEDCEGPPERQQPEPPKSSCKLRSLDD